MSHQTKGFVLILIAIMMLIMALMQSACEKDKDKARDYISQVDFINALKGRWNVTTYLKTPLTYENWMISFSYAGNSIHYISAEGESGKYATNDPFLCTIPEIENMQNWTISNSGYLLLLETTDLCGITKNYTIEYSGYRYHTEDGSVFKSQIDAIVTLSSDDTTMSLSHFNISNISANNRMYFYRKSKDIKETFYLSQQ